MTSFEIMNKEGLEVQEIVKTHLEQSGITVIDVSQDKEYQKVDIDFILKKYPQETTLEVKKDKSLYRTGNIFIECGFQRGNFYSAGWAKYCEADYICYYDTYRRRGLIADRPKLLSLLDKGKKINFYDRVDNRTGIAILIPMKIAKENKAIVSEWQD